MASASSRGAAQQDYIARIRHSNALPPPPFPPKLLDIPNTGLSSGQYTNPGFGTRLLREQPLVIEADEFSGMDFNLIGFPGAFEGDDRYLSFPSYPVEPHPKDRALLRPLNAHGKATATPAGVSFLRRTEYTTGGSSVLNTKVSNRRQQSMESRQQKPQKTAVDANDPNYILRNVIKGFNVAYPHDAYRGPDTESDVRGAEITGAEKDAWERPRNPLRDDLALIESYPLLPDLDGLPDLGAYVMVKFHGNPGDNGKNYDKRLDGAILKPYSHTQEAIQTHSESLANWEATAAEAGTKAGPKPELMDEFELYLPETEDSIRGLKRKFDVTDPQADDPLLYDGEGEGGPCFKVRRVRKFETQNKVSSSEDLFGDSVALALHDPETFVGYAPGAKSRLQKGAYFYPMLARYQIRQARPVTVNMLASQRAEVEDQVDILDLRIISPDDDTKKSIADQQAKYDIVKT